MQKKISFSSYLLIGAMLFALFFGAGNLIFPAQLGQQAGTNLWLGMGGFLITGVGLPLLGIWAMGFSGSNNLQELANRVHPVYGVLFTASLYLTIGPFFAAPRTGAVAYEIGISPLIQMTSFQEEKIALFIFTLLFFAVTLWLSLTPSKIVDRIGKYMSPAIIILLLVLLVMAVIRPIGSIEGPVMGYVEDPFVTGFLEGYNTMDALASLVFGIIVINVIRSMGIQKRSHIFLATAKTGIVTAVLLGMLYIGIAYLGATTTGTFGLFENGGPVLSQASFHYLGIFGMVILAVIIILACLTTSIGLITACSEYFRTLFPKISYRSFAILFTVFCFIIANFGLKKIISYSVPVLMVLYPLAIVLMLLTFVSPLFFHKRYVYMTSILVTFFTSIVHGFTTFYKTIQVPFPKWLSSIVDTYERVLPFYEQGLGWLIPVGIVLLFTTLIARLQNRATKAA